MSSGGDQIDPAANGPEETLSKSEFAARIQVNAARVTQYSTAGQISGDALVGTSGRNQRIRFRLAIEQLRERLDRSQMAGRGKHGQLYETGPVVVAFETRSLLERSITECFNRARDEALQLLRIELGRK